MPQRIHLSDRRMPASIHTYTAYIQYTAYCAFVTLHDVSAYVRVTRAYKHA